jgi:hypothetical protein
MKKKQARRRAPEWRVGPHGVRFTVRAGGRTLRDKDGKPRTFRTRDAAARVARTLNRK